MNRRIRRQLDIASHLSFFTYASSTVVIPVSIVALTSELGFSLTQAGSLSLAGSIVMFVVLLASVPASALWGKIQLLRNSLWILALGLLLFTQTQSYIYALLITTIIASGQGIAEALLTPLVEDIHPGDDGSNQLLLQASWPFGVIFGTIIIGEGLSRGISWRWAFVFVALMCSIVGFLYPSRKKAKLPSSKADFSHMGEVLSEPLFWIMGMTLFASGAVEGAFAFWTASYIQIEFGTLAREGGIAVAIFSAGMGVGRLSSSRIIVRLGIKQYLMICAASIVVLSAGFFLVNNPIPLHILMFFIGFAVAPLWPCIQTYSVRKMPQADPTMIMAFLSCLGILGFSSSSFLMGIIGDRFGLRVSFLIVPAIAIGLITLFFMEGQYKGNRFSNIN